VSDRWSSSDVPRGADYDARFTRLAAAGVDVHGEADLVESYRPTAVLDAGCGTGRVALELHRRGVAVMGLDVDPAMLAAARAKAPELRWVEGDLADPDLDLGPHPDLGPDLGPGLSPSPGTGPGPGDQTFDIVVLAGNVLIFVEPGTEGAVLANAARWLAPGGRLIAGYSLSTHGFGPAAHDALAGAAGLTLEDRWASWDRVPFTSGANYACSVHRKVF